MRLLIPALFLLRAVPAAGAAQEPPEVPGDIRIRAETQEVLEKGHSRARGFVDVVAGEVRIQADQLDAYQIEKPDGTKATRVVAEGNVVFLKGDERLSGDRLTMEMDTGRGVFENAMGYVQPGVFVEGKTIERVDAEHYRVEGAKFTSCAQPSPRWGFSASSARIHVDDKIVATNVVFKVKQVPAFYIPYMMYPIRDDQRSTGFLFPDFGYSSFRGFSVGEGFFWAMGRSFDQTFFADQYSKFGHGYGHEFRYSLAPSSRGTFRSYFFWPKASDSRQYQLDWNALQQLPGKFRATVFVNRYSDISFQQQIQDSLNRASTRSQTARFSVQGSVGPMTVQALADSAETQFGNQTRVTRHLPSVRLSKSPGKVGKTGVTFGFEARAESLGRGLFKGDDKPIDRYSRYDLNPEIALPIALSFLQLTPRVEARYTRYGASRSEENAAKLVAVPLERRYVETSVETRGPTFSRVFTNSGGFYSEKVKHVIGPEATFRYRTAVDDFRRIPRFDADDQVIGTNQVEYALMQRLLAKRPGAGGKAVPYEFLTWRVGQTYYFDTNNGQSDFDPFYTSTFFSNVDAGKHRSPIQSHLKFQPTPGFRTNFNLEYDLSRSQVRTLSLNSTLSGPRASLQTGWSKTAAIQITDTRMSRPLNTVRTSARLEVLPKRVTLDGSAAYDFVRKELVQSTARLRYDVQCCGFMVEAIQYNFNARQDRQFRFSIELANIGSIGNFNGEEQGRASSVGSGVFR